MGPPKVPANRWSENGKSPLRGSIVSEVSVSGAVKLLAFDYRFEA
jgi:hypothetical protein